MTAGETPAAPTLEHIRAIWATPAAQQAASEVKGGVTRLVKRLESEARKSSAGAERELEEDAERDDPRRVERNPVGRKTSERKASERSASEQMEAEAPRSPQKSRLRALSAEVPADDGL